MYTWSTTALLLLSSAVVFSQERGVELMQQGRCAEALPLLRKTIPADKEAKRRVGFAGVRCAMTVNSRADATYFLDALQREFPKDPEILFMAVHVYSDLSIRASQELLMSAPASAQVHQLNAEALETQGE